MMGPKFEALAAKTPSVKFIKVDVDQGEDIAAKYKISSIPAFYLFKNGQQVENFVGANEAKLNEFVAKAQN